MTRATSIGLCLLVLSGCVRLDEDGDGFTVLQGDCEEGDPEIHPDAQEYCDGIDNNCDGATDEFGALGGPTFYADDDGDGVGLETSTTEACSVPPGYAEVYGDCWEGNAEVFPGADELCDHLDNNCDGEIDEDSAIDAVVWYPDFDGDGFGDQERPVRSCTAPPDHIVDGADCDDVDPNVHPDATESCLTPADDNCDGDSNNEDAIACSLYFEDADNDTFGGAGACFCEPVAPYFLAIDDDCDDTDPEVHPDAEELENWVDNNCDGVATLSLSSAASTYVGISAGDRLGSALGVADLNGDGRQQLLMGASEYESDQGALLVVDLDVSGVVLLDKNNTRSVGSWGSRAGISLANVGDLNSDGRDDVLVGAYRWNLDWGASYLLEGPIAGQTTLKDAAVAILWGSDYNYAGHSVAAAGDLTGDGIPDLLVASPTYSGDAIYGGGVFLVPGPLTGDVYLDEGISGRFVGTTSWDSIRVASAPDLDGDGVDDVLIGQPGRDGACGSDCGQAHVLFEMAAGAFNSGDLSYMGHYYQGKHGACLAGLGDINGDGYGDWASGASKASALQVDAGHVALFYGQAAWADSNLTPDVEIAGPGTNAGLCFVEAVGDLDADGQQDLVLGAPGASVEGVEAGTAHVLFGPFDERIDLSKSGAQLVGESALNRAGSRVFGPGDVNADGFDDILVSALGYPDANGNGAVYLMLGGAR